MPDFVGHLTKLELVIERHERVKHQDGTRLTVLHTRQLHTDVLDAVLRGKVQDRAPSRRREVLCANHAWHD